MELDAILAVVIGGTSLAGGKFSILGSTVGALLIATLNKTVLFLGVSAAATPAFKAIVIVVLCLLQSERVSSWPSGTKSPAARSPTPSVRIRPPVRRRPSHERVRARPDAAPRRPGPA